MDNSDSAMLVYVLEEAWGEGCKLSMQEVFELDFHVYVAAHRQRRGS